MATAAKNRARKFDDNQKQITTFLPLGYETTQQRSRLIEWCLGGGAATTTIRVGGWGRVLFLFVSRLLSRK